MSAGTRTSAALTAVALAVLTACGTASNDTLQSPSASATDATTATTDAPPTANGEATTSAVSTSTTAITEEATQTETTLPGVPVDWPYFPAGAQLAVVGVAFDDELSVHALPGAEQPVVASLPPLATGIVSKGRVQRFDLGGWWLEIDTDGTVGWASLRSFTYLGRSFDLTADVIADFGGIPTAPTMIELGDIMLEAVYPVPSDAGVAPASLVVAGAPTSGPTSEMVLDVFPGEWYGDDTSNGSRWRVVAQQVANGTLPATGIISQVVYELVSVEATTFCSRGVTTDSLCV
jgi:hypothetical protein